MQQRTSYPTTIGTPDEGTSSYRMLSYYFTLRCEAPLLGGYVRHVLAPFAVPPDPWEHPSPPTPGVPIAYELHEAADPPRYRLSCNGTALLWSDDPADPLAHLLWHVNAETFRRTGDFLLIHAGAVRTPDGAGVLLPGASGAGKSTLVAALVRAGFGYLSDEAAALDPVTRQAYPYARAVAFKRDPAALLGQLPVHPPPAGTHWHALPDDLRAGATAGPCKVGYVVALRRDPDRATTTVAPLSRAAAVAELARQALNLGRYGARGLRLLADVVTPVSAVELTVGTLDDGVAAVAALTDATLRP